jgi:hypothetical protein
MKQVKEMKNNTEENISTGQEELSVAKKKMSIS